MPRAIWQDTVVAESDDVVVVDGYTYFPRSAVAWERLESSDRTSVCPWKGQATYYSVVVGGQRNADAAWEYADPKPDAAMVRDRISFWRGVQIVG